MLTTTLFLTAAKWAGIFTLVCAVLAVLAFVLKWGIRFRLVGVTGFAGVLTVGLFSLGLVPFTHTVIPGAKPFKVVYDLGSTQAVIKVSPQISESELDATLRQAASDLFSLGRLGRGKEQLIIRARTVLHPEPGVSQPLYVGQIQRSLSVREDEQTAVTLFPESLAQLPKPSA